MYDFVNLNSEVSSPNALSDISGEKVKQEECVIQPEVTKLYKHALGVKQYMYAYT